MRDLTAQLARYGEYLLETTPVVTFEPDPVRVIPPAGSEPPLQRKVPSWAFAVIAAVVAVAIGIGGFLLLGQPGTAPVTDEGPTPPPTSPATIAPASTTVATTPGTTAPVPTSTSPSPAAGAFPDQWTPVAVGAPWTERIIDVEALPDGGFVLANSAPDSPTVVWSPNGFDWFDGDPLRRLPEQLGPVGRPDPAPPKSMAVVGDRVAVLDWRMSVWSGDPRTGDWQEIPLDVEDGEEGNSQPGLALASNGSQVLVVGAHQGDSGGGYAMWLVDPLKLTSARVSPLATGPVVWSDTPQVGWFDGRWLVGANVMVDEPSTNNSGAEERNMLWSSTDAVSWSEVDHPMDYMGLLLPRGPRLFVLGAFDLWATSDLVDWELKRAGDDETDFVVPSYSEDLGYFGFADMDPDGPGETWLMVSDDGTNWTPVGPSRYGDVLAVSGDRVLLSDFGDLWLLTSEEPAVPGSTTTNVSTSSATALWLDEATHNEIYSEVGPAWADAFIAGDPAALAALYRSDAVHVDGITGDEARGRDQIEAAFARHFAQIQYATLTLNGWSTGPAQQTDDGRLLTVRLHWDWEAAPGDTTLYGIPAVSRILIDIDSRLIVWSTHPDWEA